MLVRFATDADEIELKVTRHSLDGEYVGGRFTGRQDDIMPYNGRFGIDIHAQDDKNGNAWRWFGTSGGAAQNQESHESFSGLRPLPDGSPRKFTLYFPTHIPVTSVQIGVPAAASITPFEPPKGQKLVQGVIADGPEKLAECSMRASTTSGKPHVRTYVRMYVRT